MLTKNVILKSRPEKEICDSNFIIKEERIKEPLDNQVLVKTMYLSVDPYMRPKMTETKSYTEPFELNKPMHGIGLGQVIKSKHTNFNENDFVFSDHFQWSNIQVIDGDKLNKIKDTSIPLEKYLDALGMNGLTAYFGLFRIAKIKEGQTIVVSSAGGSVGSIVGQIAKLKGCRVIGIVGNEEKASWIKNELGFDEAINYNKGDVSNSLKRMCPDGIDIYWDNVGGSLLENILENCKVNARIVLCGAISEYQKPLEERHGVRNLFKAVQFRLTLKGFIVYDFVSQFDNAINELSGWLKSGKIKTKETTFEGLENTPKALQALFKGENIGKAIVKVA